ncbi:hypothetical protein DXU84_24665 [Rahnella sp. RcJ3]|nr:hypothetical protein [Rahnella sp. RcJ3]
MIQFSAAWILRLGEIDSQEIFRLNHVSGIFSFPNGGLQTIDEFIAMLVQSALAQTRLSDLFGNNLVTLTLYVIQS